MLWFPPTQCLPSSQPQILVRPESRLITIYNLFRLYDFFQKPKKKLPKKITPFLHEWKSDLHYLSFKLKAADIKFLNWVEMVLSFWYDIQYSSQIYATFSWSSCSSRLDGFVNDFKRGYVRWLERRETRGNLSYMRLGMDGFTETTFKRLNNYTTTRVHTKTKAPTQR